MKRLIKNSILLYLLILLFLFIAKPNLLNLNSVNNNDIKCILPILFVIISIICYYIMALITD